jgi:acyl carrier protein
MKNSEKEINFLFKYLKIKKSKQIDIDYINEGYLDSLGFIKFIVYIEKNFKIKFNQSDFMHRKFRTIKGLANIIKKKHK